MPTLCPPLDLYPDSDSSSGESEKNKIRPKSATKTTGTSMLSPELRESFETVQAIHRVQLHLDGKGQTDGRRQYLHDDETMAGSNPNENIKMEPFQSHGHDEYVASQHNHMEHDTSLTNASLTEANVKAWKFEAALKAAMVAEAEISQLTNGIAELEEMLLQEEAGGHHHHQEGGNDTRIQGDGARDMNVVDNGTTTFPSLPPLVCDDGHGMKEDGVDNTVHMEISPDD